MAHLSTKSYGNERGLSCCSRQWAADSHCNLLHGYSFGFHFVFAAEQLDKRGWVLDFGKGGFGLIKAWLHEMFDHTLLVAEDDPERPTLEALGAKGLADIRIVPGTSCERMAEMAFKKADEIVREATQGRCWWNPSSVQSTAPTVPSIAPAKPWTARPKATGCDPNWIDPDPVQSFPQISRFQRPKFVRYRMITVS